MSYFLLATGLVLLLVCGDALVRGAVAIAEKLEIPPLIIGLTIVAFGTSAPELVVSLRAALTGSPGIAIGNVVGSNIANVLLVLGVPALISSTNCDQPRLTRNALYVIGASVLFIMLCFMQPLAFWHGALLFALMVAFLVEAGRRAGRRTASGETANGCADDLLDDVSDLPTHNLTITAFLLVGLIGLPFAAHLTVTSASDIAMGLGVSEAAIGLSLVAIGTSLPELATTLAAALRGNCGVALGNVLGSNLFNLLAIMGLTAMVAPIPVPAEFLRMDLWVMLATSLIILPFALRRTSITRTPAIAFVACYVVYIVLVFAPRMNNVATAVN